MIDLGICGREGGGFFCRLSWKGMVMDLVVRGKEVLIQKLCAPDRAIEVTVAIEIAKL